jgi:hypothetical protein
MRAVVIVGAVLAGIVVIDLSWRTIAFLASTLIFTIGRMAYEHAAHLLGL